MASDIFHRFLTLSRDWTSFNVQVEITVFGDCSSSYGFFGNRQDKGNLKCFARLHIGRVQFKRMVITWVIRDAVKSYLAEGKAFAEIPKWGSSLTATITYIARGARRGQSIWDVPNSLPKCLTLPTLLECLLCMCMKCGPPLSVSERRDTHFKGSELILFTQPISSKESHDFENISKRRNS